MKLYKSRVWMKKQYQDKRKSPEQIAKELGVSHMTIRRWLEKHGLMR